MLIFLLCFSHTISHTAGKIWSLICILDIVKSELHYQINLIRLIKVISRFLYQICLIDKSDENIYLSV